MEKEFVPYELAVKLKALVFDEPCFATYDEDKNFELQDFFQTYETFPSHIIAVPTFSQAFRWFREKYNLHHCIMKMHDYFFDKTLRIHTETYEKAELACLDKLIEIVEGIESQK